MVCKVDDIHSSVKGCAAPPSLDNFNSWVNGNSIQSPTVRRFILDILILNNMFIHFSLKWHTSFLNRTNFIEAKSILLLSDCHRMKYI